MRPVVEKKVASNAIGLDVRRTKAVDIIADARLLPLRDETLRRLLLPRHRAL